MISTWVNFYKRGKRGLKIKVDPASWSLKTCWDNGVKYHRARGFPKRKLAKVGFDFFHFQTQKVLFGLWKLTLDPWSQLELNFTRGGSEDLKLKLTQRRDLSKPVEIKGSSIIEHGVSQRGNWQRSVLIFSKIFDKIQGCPPPTYSA